MVTTQDIINAYNATVGAGTMSEADFVNRAMNEFGVSANQLADARASLLAPQAIEQITASGSNTPVTVGGVTFQPIFSEQGAGETLQRGLLEQVIAYDPTKTATGQSYAQLSPTGEFLGTGQFKEVDSLLPQFLAGSALLFGGLGGLMGNGIFGSLGSGAGSGAFLGEGIASGIPAWDAAYGGALLEGGAGLGAAGTAANTASGVSKLLSNIPGNITSNLVSGLLTAGLANNIAGGAANTGVGGIPTQGIPINTPEYYQQMQGFLNQYLPGQMPSQTQYLQDWYKTLGLNGVTNSLFSSYLPSGAVAVLPTAPLKPRLPPLTLPESIFTSTPEQKADLYRQLLNTGYTDEQIRIAAGNQTDADWQALQQLASGKRTPAPAPVAAPAPAPSTSLTIPQAVFTGTPIDKATYYNSLINQGYSDAQIRAAAGAQTDADWKALQSIASSLR